MQYQEQKLYTGNPRQLFSVRESRLLGGKMDGVRVADIHNGGNLEVCVAVLKANELTYVLCTVTRYFGGILLGAGGLVRAYSSGAADAVKAAGVEKHIPGALIALRCDYSRYSAIESLIAKSNAAITESEFTDEIRLSISCAKGEADSIIKAIIERTDGRCKPEIAGECELVLPQ